MERTPRKKSAEGPPCRRACGLDTHGIFKDFTAHRKHATDLLYEIGKTWHVWRNLGGALQQTRLGAEHVAPRLKMLAHVEKGADQRHDPKARSSAGRLPNEDSIVINPLLVWPRL